MLGTTCYNNMSETTMRITSWRVGRACAHFRPDEEMLMRHRVLQFTRLSGCGIMQPEDPICYS